MTSPLYIQQGPSPTWWNSPAIWVTAQGDPSTGPKVISPIVGKPYTVWVEIQNFYMEADTGGWNLFVCWGIPFTGTLPLVNIGQILNGAMTSAGPQGAPITVTIPGGTLTSPGIVTLPAATTWTPTLENGGHECLVAAVYDEQDIGGLPDFHPAGRGRNLEPILFRRAAQSRCRCDLDDDGENRQISLPGLERRRRRSRVHYRSVAGAAQPDRPFPPRRAGRAEGLGEPGQGQSPRPFGVRQSRIRPSWRRRRRAWRE